MSKKPSSIIIICPGSRAPPRTIPSASKRRNRIPPRIDIGNDHHQVCEEAYQALVQANDKQWPDVVVRPGGAIAKLDHDERTLVAIDSETIVEELSRAADFVRFDAAGNASPVKPPVDVAKALMKGQGHTHRGLPRAIRVVDVPMVVKERSRLVLHDVPGLHRPSGVLYVPAEELSGLQVPADVHDVNQLRQAVAYLRGNLFHDFTFHSAADEAHAWCLMLLPFIRETIKGPTPLHAITSPKPNTGKSWLARVCLAAGCGKIGDNGIPETKHGTDEWRKQITSLLLRGESAVLFDNLSSKLDAGPLLAAVTTTLWQDRILGKSEQVSLPARNIWVVTGNNVQLDDQMTTRSVPMVLDPRKPGKTKYVHHDLDQWVLENRKDLVYSVLILLRHWVQGRVASVDAHGTIVRASELLDTEWVAPTFDQGIELQESRFPDWFAQITSLLQAVDLGSDDAATDPALILSNAAEFASTTADIDSTEDATFVEALYNTYGGEARSIGTLEGDIAVGGQLYDVLPTVLRGEKVSKIGYWLRDRKDRPYGPYMIRHIKGNRPWRIEKEEEQA